MARSDEDWDDLEVRLERFENAWKEAIQRGEAAPDLYQFLPPNETPFRKKVLNELVATDLEYRWNQGETPDLNTYLIKYPELGPAESVSGKLIFEEYRIRMKHGMQVKLADYQKRFPVRFEEVKKLVEEHPSARPTPNPNLSTQNPPVSVRPGAGVIVAPSQGAKIRDYELLEIIGEGGFAEVWRAKSTTSGILVALKNFYKPISTGEVQRELESLELVKGLRHPFLLQVQNYWIEGRSLYVVMELATDGNLKDRLDACRREGLRAIPAGELYRYFENVAAALDYLHDRGIQHRDIKPQNILLVEGYAKLADFGLARQMTTGRDVTKTMGGTPAYQAPEMFEGDFFNRKSDQYCLAYTYAELRLGRLPFNFRSEKELARAHKFSKPTLDSMTPAEQDVLLKALAKAPGDRFDTCADFMRSLDKALSRTPEVRAAPAPRPAPPRESAPPPASPKHRTPRKPTPEEYQATPARPPAPRTPLQEQPPTPGPTPGAPADTPTTAPSARQTDMNIDLGDLARATDMDIRLGAASRATDRDINLGAGSRKTDHEIPLDTIRPPGSGPLTREARDDFPTVGRRDDGPRTAPRSRQPETMEAIDLDAQTAAEAAHWQQLPEPHVRRTRRWPFVVVALLFAAAGATTWLAFHERDTINERVTTAMSKDEYKDAVEAVRSASPLTHFFRDQLDDRLQAAARERSEALVNSKDFEQASDKAKQLHEHFPDLNVLAKVQDKWYESVAGQIKAGELGALEQVLKFQARFPREAPPGGDSLVKIAKALDMTGANKRPTEALAAIDGLVKEFSQFKRSENGLRRPIYEALITEPLGRGRYKDAYAKLAEQKSIPPDLDKELRGKVFDALATRVAKANYRELDGLDVKDVLPILTPDQQDTIKRYAKRTFSEQVDRLYQEIKTDYDKDPKSCQRRIDDAERLPGLLSADFGVAVDDALLYKARFWKSRSVIENLPKDATKEAVEAFERYFTLIELRKSLASGDSLADHTRGLLRLAQENKAVENQFKNKEPDLVKLAKAGAFGSAKDELERFLKALSTTPFAQILAQAATKYKDGFWQETHDELYKIRPEERKDLDPTQQREFAALGALADVQLAFREPKQPRYEKASEALIALLEDKDKAGPRGPQMWKVLAALQEQKFTLPRARLKALAEAWLQLESVTKTEDHLSPLVAKYLEREVPAWPADGDKGWTDRLQWCALTKKKTVWVSGCELEGALELKRELPKIPSLTNIKLDPGDKAAQAYVAYVEARVKATNGQLSDAADLLVASAANLSSLPAKERKERIATLLMDSAKAKRSGALAGQYADAKEARAAYTRLNLASTILEQEKNLAAPDTLPLDLTLALGNAGYANQQERDLAIRSAKMLLDRADFFADKDLAAARYPVMVAYAAALERSPSRKLEAYSDILVKLSRQQLEAVSPLELSREVLQPGLAVGAALKAESFVNDADKKNLARLMGRQARLILESANKNPPNWGFADPLQKAHDLYREAADFDDSKVEYVVGKVKSAAVLPGLDWKQLDGWSKEAVDRFPSEAYSHWTSGWTKLHLARLEKTDDAKLATYAGSEKELDKALGFAKTLPADEALALAEIHLDRHQAALELGNVYASMPYGHQKKHQAEEKMPAQFRAALSHAQSALKAVQAAAADPAAKDVEIAIHESLGNAHEDMALFVKEAMKNNFKKAADAFEAALQLGSKRPATETGYGRVLYNAAVFAPPADKTERRQLLDDAEKHLLAALGHAKDPMEKVEPNYFLAHVYAVRDDDVAKMMKTLEDTVKLFEDGGAAGGAAGAAGSKRLTAEGYVRYAIDILTDIRCATAKRRLDEVANPDPVAAAKEKVAILKKMLGAAPGRYDTAVVVLKHREMGVLLPKETDAELQANIRELERNLKAAPNDFVRVWSHVILAGEYLTRKQLTESIKHYQAGLKLADELLDTHGGGDIQKLIERRDRDDTGYENWRELWRSYRIAALLLRQSGQPEEAIAMVDRAIAVAPDGERAALQKLKDSIKPPG